MWMMRNVAWVALLGLRVTAAVAATDGLDPRFGVDGVVLLGTTPVSAHTLATSHGIAVQPDGKFLIATSTGGYTVEPNPQPTQVAAVVRLNADGSWDESFGDHGIYAFPGSATVSAYGGEARSIALTSDGSIIAAGETYTQSSGGEEVHSCALLFRISASGVLDPTFGTDGSLCFDFAPEPPGVTYYYNNPSIAVGVDDFLYLTTPLTNLGYGAVARFAPDGALDASYGSGGIARGADDMQFAALVLDADQRIVATGGEVTYRFTDSGLPDATFGSGGELQIDFGAYPTVYAQSAMLDGEGRLVSALFSNLGATGDFPMSRTDTHGTLDPTFNGAQQQPGFPGFAAAPIDDQAALAFAVPAQGSVFAVGVLDPMGYTMGLARFNDDASFDTAYGDPAHPGWTGLRIGTDATSINAPYGVTKDSAGRVLIVGVFSSDLGWCNGILRFIPDDLFNAGLDPAPVRACPP